MSHQLLTDLRKPAKLNTGSLILFQEDVFFHVSNSEKPQFCGSRTTLAQVQEPGIIGYVIVKIIGSKGICALPAGVSLQKPIANLMRGYEMPSDVINNIYLKVGGHLEGIKDGEKVVLDDASKGGVSVGANHGPEGGIKGTVGTERRPIEFENKELILGEKVSEDKRVYSFEGQMITAKEVASRLNSLNGGVDFAEKGQDLGTPANPISFKGNEIILTAPVSEDKRVYSFEGQQMTAKQIASRLNSNNNGVSF